MYEKFHDKSLAIDNFFNRLCLKSSKSASVTWYDPLAFLETKGGEPLVLGGTELYRRNKQTDVSYGHDNPPVQRINLNEVDEFSRPVMEDLIQSIQLETGIVNAADASSADLNSSKTATGIRNIERTGNTVQRATENIVADDVTAVVGMAVDMVLENMDPQETQWIASEQRLATLNRNEIRRLPRDIRLLLTKSEASEGIDVAQQVLATIKEYYGYPPQLQKKLRPAFMQILKDLDRPDADTILHDPTDAEIQAASQAQANQAKVNEQFRAMLSDVGPLTPAERGQILGMFGVQPSPDADVAQAQQQAATMANTTPAAPGIPGLPAPASNVVPMAGGQQ
jgi:hypothetical protein